ncbi:MAG: inorganic triphosphatase, partial [Fluviibacter sp.]
TIMAQRGGRQGQTPLCELELELKSGDAAALSVLAARLQAQVALRPSDESKAARGYALFHSLAA